MTGAGHLLVGSIGTSDYDTVTYELEGETTETELSPVALVELLNGHPTIDIEISAALIVRTPEAGEKNDDRLEAAFTEAGIKYELADIDLITDKSDIDTILRTVVDELRGDTFDEPSVVLDISHSFRSLPMVFLLSLMQLEALEENVTLEKIYYSRFAGSREYDEAPVIDLTYLRTLIRWYDAFETAQRTGTLRGIRLLLEAKREELFVNDDSDHPAREDFADFVGSFKGAQKAIDTGFALETGFATKNALTQLAKLDDAVFIGPEGTVLKPLELLLEGSETEQDASAKTELQLTEDELQREAEIVKFYLESEQYRIALVCGRELFINRLLYDADQRDEWLNRDCREAIALPPGHKGETVTHDVADVQRLWDRIRKARNAYAHAGFNEEGRPNDRDVEDGLEKLCEHIDNDAFWQA